MFDRSPVALPVGDCIALATTADRTMHRVCSVLAGTAYTCDM